MFRQLRSDRELREAKVTNDFGRNATLATLRYAFFLSVYASKFVGCGPVREIASTA